MVSLMEEVGRYSPQKLVTWYIYEIMKHLIIQNIIDNLRKEGNSMKINEETVRYVAALAKLTVSEEEKEKVAQDLDHILDYIETMNQLDTDGIEPMSHVLPVKNVFREDVVTNQNDRDQLLINAPRKKDGSFVVPKTVE